MSTEKYYWICQNGSHLPNQLRSNLRIGMGMGERAEKASEWVNNSWERFCLWRNGVVSGLGSFVYQDGKHYSKSIFLGEWPNREGELDDAGEGGNNSVVHTPVAWASPVLRNADSPPRPQTHQVRSCILTSSQVTHNAHESLTRTKAEDQRPGQKKKEL